MIFKILFQQFCEIFFSHAYFAFTDVWQIKIKKEKNMTQSPQATRAASVHAGIDATSLWNCTWEMNTIRS